MPREKKIIHLPPNVGQQYKRTLGMYGATFGVNKYHHLLNAIDLAIARIHREDPTLIYEEITADLKKLKEYEEKTGNKTFYSHLGKWNDIYDKLEDLRKDLYIIQQAYDDMRTKKIDPKKDPKSFLKFKKASRKVSPYTPELFYLFVIVNEITNMQMMVIPNEYYKSPEMSEIHRNPFIKVRPQHQSSPPQQTEPTAQNPEQT